MDGQDETMEETLARHERMLQDFCKRNNLIIVETYKEVITGDSIEVRPQMQRLLENVEDKLYDGVVVIELERLSRGNPVDQFIVADTFKKSNTLIYTLTKTYNLSSEDEFDEEFFEFGLFMSRREYKTIRRRLVRGRLQAQKEGYFVGSVPPYGYSKEKQGKGYVLVPNEYAEVVKIIFNKYVYENENTSDIARYLNSQGFKSPANLEWRLDLVGKILNNKVYLGYNNFNVNTKMRKEEKEVLPGLHQPLIDNETFELAQARLKVRMTKNKHSTILKNPLATIFKCSFCNTPLTLKQRKEHLYCRKVGCQNHGIYLETAEKRVIEELHNELDNFNYFLINYSDEIDKKKLNKENEIKLLQKEINKKESMINKCCEMLEEGIYTKEKYLSRVKVLEEELGSLKSNLSDLKAAPLDEADKVRTAIPKLEKVLNEYWNLSPKEKNLLLKSIIEKIEYTKTKKKTWKSSDEFDLKIYLKI